MVIKSNETGSFTVVVLSLSFETHLVSGKIAPLAKLLNDLTQLWIFLLRRAVWTKPIYLKDWTLCSFKVEFREPCLHWRPASLHFNLFRRATQLLRIHPSFLPSAPKTSGWKHRIRSDPAYCMSTRCLPSYGHDKDKGRPPPRIVC